MALYIWRDELDPEAENQKAFVDAYILDQFGSTPEDWKNGVSDALYAYWLSQGYETDPEEGAFILPEDYAVLAVPIPPEQKAESHARMKEFIRRYKEGLNESSVQ